METIYYTKRFTSENLKGIAILDKVSFSSAAQCAKAVYIGKTGKDYGTNDKWIIEDASFQNYKRT